jgi:hypothetical protein
MSFHFEFGGLDTSLCVELFFCLFTNRLERAAYRSPLELPRQPGYVLVLNLLWFGIPSLDLRPFGIPGLSVWQVFQGTSMTRCGR